MYKSLRELGSNNYLIYKTLKSKNFYIFILFIKKKKKKKHMD